MTLSIPCVEPEKAATLYTDILARVIAADMYACDITDILLLIASSVYVSQTIVTDSNQEECRQVAREMAAKLATQLKSMTIAVQDEGPSILDVNQLTAHNTN